VNVVALASVQAQPWRNGGGMTRELLAWPEGAAWQCRISVADIERDGDFSAFPGVERWFAVIEGAGVELGFEAGPVPLSPKSEPCKFDGTAAPGCRLLAGPTRDLNLMAQQATGHGRMQRVLPGQAWHSSAALRAVFCTGALQLHRGTQAAISLPAASLAWTEHDAGTPWHTTQLSGAAPAWWLAFHRHAA
jgi:uncharacterized protein